MKSKNTIELNGQRYDASSGSQLRTSVATPSRAIANIDGFFHAATTAPASTLQNGNVSVTASLQTPLVPQKSRGQQTGHTHAHKPQAAITLMRGAVTRPQPGFKQQIQVQSSLQPTVPNLIASKRSAYSLDGARLQRARSVGRSPFVSRHSTNSQQIAVTFAPLSVQPVPVKPEAKEPATVPEPTVKPLDLFEQAVANASHYIDVKTHHAKFKKHRRNHALSLAGGGLALIVIAGFVAYQNSPSLQLKIASFRSGVSASVPNTRAIGFSYEGAKASAGKLTMHLTSHGAQYQLVQQNTNLSNTDLAGNVASVDASGNPTYGTVQAGGTIVYRLNNNDATWVSSGKWYTVSGGDALTNTQVTDLVKNL